MPTALNGQRDSLKDWKFVLDSEVELLVSGMGKRVCVFCGSSSDVPPAYVEATSMVGQLLAEHGCALVYGGGTMGLMGVLPRTAAAHGIQSILGVVPEIMRANMCAPGGEGYGQVVQAKDMAERKAIIARHSDVFMALPGGFGTLDEFSEMMTWMQVGYHCKLVALLNVDGFFDGLLQWIERAVKDGLIRSIFLENLLVESDPAVLIRKLLERSPKDIPGKFRTKG